MNYKLHILNFYTDSGTLFINNCCHHRATLFKQSFKQTKKHSSRMLTARFSSCLGVCPTPRLQTPPPRCRHPYPQMQTPPVGRPPLNADPPRCRPPVDRQTPLKTLPCLKLRLWAVNMYQCRIFDEDSGYVYVDKSMVYSSSFY